MVRCVLICGDDTWLLYEDEGRRINGAEMDTLRRSARNTRLERKTKVYIREKWKCQIKY
jgi:hypothetical protein